MEPHEAAEYRVWKARQASRDQRHIEERDARDADEYKSMKAQQVERNERYREEKEAAKYKSPKGTQIARYKTRSDEYYAWQAREISMDKRDMTEREERYMKGRKADWYDSWRAREEEERYMKERKADRYDSWHAREEERDERYMKERKADRYDLRQARKVEREERYKEEKPVRVRKRTEENQILGSQNKRVNISIAREEHMRKSTQSPERSDKEVQTEKHMLTWEQREQIRFQSLQRKKDFVCLEKINDKIVNILEGLELHTGVFSTKEQMRIVDFVYERASCRMQ